MNKTIDVNENTFEQEVLKSAQPVLVDFWGPGCAPCRMIAPVLEEIAAENAGRVKVVKVNTAEEQMLAVRYGITAIPTLLFFANGQVTSQVRGAVSKKTIMSNLNLPAVVA